MKKWARCVSKLSVSVANRDFVPFGVRKSK